jgi:anti-sigma-K factor RskA
MNEERSEVLIDLLIKQATEGLSADESAQLSELESGFDGVHNLSFERTAAAIGMISVRRDEKMPAHLRSRLLAKSEEVFDELEAVAAPEPERYRPTELPRRSLWDWMGWAVAAVACMALVINIWLTRIQTPPEVVSVQPTPSPLKLSPAEQRQELLRSAGDVVLASVAAGNVPDVKNITGDIVWSDSKQTGYMRFRGLPANDRSRETYQLWIFDETQDEKTPIDGGTFDVNENGEVVIPINAKLRALHPKLFAVTIEKPGGVVVSKREKIVALAKTQA